MSNHPAPLYNPAELRAKVSKHLENLSQLTSDAARSDQMKAYLEASAKFYRYSPFNQLLIMFANPDATHVAGFRRWQTLNRYVRRGEKGIPILAPCVTKTKDESGTETKRVTFFKIAYVFDISQTEGEPLPVVEWRSPAKLAELEAALLAYCEAKGIKVTVSDNLHGAQGTSAGGQIELDPGAGTKTLIHELAHELMHHNPGERLPREIVELEAEAVAYIVASHFKIPNLASPNYLALWDADAEKISQRAARIQATAIEIISAIEPKTEVTE